MHFGDKIYRTREIHQLEVHVSASFTSFEPLSQTEIIVINDDLHDNYTDTVIVDTVSAISGNLSKSCFRLPAQLKNFK